MTSYTVLRADLDTWTSRSDMGEVADTIIRMAEAEIYRDVRIAEQVVSTNLTLTTQTYDLTSPTDLRVTDILSISLADTTNFTEVRELTPAVLRASPEFTMSGQPIFYAREGCNLVFGPAATSTSTVEVFMVYQQRFLPLSADNPTNDMLTRHYDYFLHVCLEKAGFVNRDAAFAALHGEKARQIKESIIQSENAKVIAQGVAAAYDTEARP